LIDLREILLSVEFPNRKIMDISKSHLAPEAKEGDVIKLVEDKWQIDQEATLKKNQEVEELTKGLWD
jgi:Protein of unknown function (DUF3006)